MKHINYILNGFGYENTSDFRRSLYGLCLSGDKWEWKLILISIAGAFRMILDDFLGFDIPVFWAFVFLVCAEVYTGVKVSRKIKGQKFKSRRFGRMILKLGVYLFIVGILNVFAKSIDAPDIMGVSLNPFLWLYYAVFIGIVFQLVASYMENLGALGYKESKSIAGFVLRKLNTWFEFDGSKENDQ